MPLKQQDSSVFDNFELRLNENSKKFLRETAKWAFILSIIGFIVIGLFLLIAIFSFVMFSAVNTSNASLFGGAGGMSMEFVFIVYFVLAILYFFTIPGLSFIYAYNYRLSFIDWQKRKKINKTNIEGFVKRRKELEELIQTEIPIA